LLIRVYGNLEKSNGCNHKKLVQIKKTTKSILLISTHPIMSSGNEILK